MTTVTTDVNSDITGLVHPQFSSTTVEASAPQVVEEFDALVYDQSFQEQIVAGEMTPNIVENPALQEQVIVQEIPPVSIVERMQAPQVVDSFPLLEDFAATEQPHIIFKKFHRFKLWSGYRSRVLSPVW